MSSIKLDGLERPHVGMVNDFISAHVKKGEMKKFTISQAV
jgi:hypothetical protein